jgi:DNA invertase Pin-like site-specific DNA recombinase
MTEPLISAAQYLRMSTEHQQYSLQNQAITIQQYADSHGFCITQTYSDAAKSGVVLKKRAGLRQLLRDVVSGTATYKVILVYDVSRWGRFQDTDESAHYEFLCKSAGVPVHYCAESFTNDCSLPSLIMKALKRTMAGEYSRELGVKVLDGQKRLARLGFKQGGIAGYGLRRMLVSPDRCLKHNLNFGERKSIATDRVILVPGPADEVQIVRDIYRMLISDKRTVYAIASELNHRGIEYTNGSQWDYQAVYAVLTHPKYTGCHVFGRTSCKLSTPTVKLPKSEWIFTPGAFEPIIDEATFAQAQRILQNRTINKSDAQVLDSLRTLLARERRISFDLIKNASDVPSPSTYRHRFGGLREAYKLIGYGRPDGFCPIDLRNRIHRLREQFLTEITHLFPGDVQIVRPGGRWRSRLRLRNGLMVSVLIARAVHVWKETISWQVDPVPRESKYITLLARLKRDNCAFLDFHVLSKIDRRKRFCLRLHGPWLSRGERLTDLSHFREVVRRVAAARRRRN